MSPHLPRIVWLVLVWLFLWEEISIGNVLSGLVVAVAIIVLFPVAPSPITGRVRPVAALRFLGYFIWKLFEANVVVAWEVLTPRDRINLGIVAVPITGASKLLTTMVANAISLTPGTLTIEVDEDPTVLYVHVLHLHDIEAVRRDVLRLETLAIEAFGSRQAIQAAADQAGGAGHQPAEEAP